MNKEKALRQLHESLEEYLCQGFRFHRLFVKELGDLLKDATGHEKEIFALLVKQLKYVAAFGKQVDQVDGNEKLKLGSKVTGQYYSLHLSAKNFNIRILMSFDGENTPVFLATFYERSGKRMTNYTQWESILESRYDEVK